MLFVPAVVWQVCSSQACMLEAWSVRQYWKMRGSLRERESSTLLSWRELVSVCDWVVGKQGRTTWLLASQSSYVFLSLGPRTFLSETSVSCAWVYQEHTMNSGSHWTVRPSGVRQQECTLPTALLIWMPAVFMAQLHLLPCLDLLCPKLLSSYLLLLFYFSEEKKKPLYFRKPSELLFFYIF